MKPYRYPGTKPFTNKDQQIFHGRKKDIDRLYDQLQSKNMVVFYAESGIGKSSLINAGLMPLFKSQIENVNYLPVKIRFGMNESKKSSKSAYKEILLSKIITQLDDEKKSFTQMEVPFADPDVNDLWHQAKLFQKNNVKLLLIFDQAEEIFTYNAKQIQFFKEQIYSLLNTYLPSYLDAKIEMLLGEFGKSADSNLNEDKKIQENVEFIYRPLNAKILLAVREDKLGAFSVFSDFFPDILKNTYKLKSLEKDEAIEAITLPGHVKGLFASTPFSFTAKGLNQLLKILVEDDNTYDPFSIQTNCSYIERSEVIENKKNIITEKDIPKKGIVEKELFDNVWKGLPDKYHDQIPTYKKAIAEKLIDIENQRRIRAYGKNLFEAEVVKLLIDEGLIRGDKESEGYYYELSHDRLVKPILENYKQKIAEDEAISITKKANKLYEKLLVRLKDEYTISDEDQRALQVLIEEQLIKDRKRVSLSYDEVKNQPNVRTDIIDLFITEHLLDVNSSNNLEISNDIYLDSILRRQQIRIIEEEKIKKDIEIASEKLKLENERLKIEFNKKRSTRNLRWGAVTVTLLSVGFVLYSIIINRKNDQIGRMAMLFKGNEYLEKGNLRKAFGIYKILKSDGGNKIINEQIDKLQLGYTDLPGKPGYAILHNQILSRVADSTYEIWKVVSNNKISLGKTYTLVNQIAFSPDLNYVAIYTRKQLILYNSKTGDDKVIKNDLPENKEFVMAFSKYLNYFSCYSEKHVFVFDLNDNYKTYKYDKIEDLRYSLSNILFASMDNLFSDYSSAITGWKRNTEGNFIPDRYYDNFDVNWNWCYLDKDSIMLVTNKALVRMNLQTHEKTTIFPGNFSTSSHIGKYPDNLLLLYNRKYSDKGKLMYANIVFYDLMKKKKITETQPNKLLESGKSLENFSVTHDRKKCLIKVAGNNNVFLINNIEGNIKPLKSLYNAAAYDISDNGNYIAYVKRAYVKKASLNDDLYNDPAGKSDSLFIFDLEKNKPNFVDLIFSETETRDTTDIYGAYFFRFNPNSDMIAYNTEKYDRLTNGYSNFLSVRRITDNEIVYESSYVTNSIGYNSKSDFTSLYIHIYEKKDDGFALLDTTKRDTNYFFKLYPNMQPKEWRNELKKVNLDIK